MTFYQQPPFYNVQIPFIGAIHEGLQEGKSVIVSGRVLPGADRFHLNLQCGSHSNADVALHFNPRYEFGTNYVVCNSFRNGGWESEERRYECPFPSGQNFTLQMLVSQDSYKISTNGRHFMDYRHRMPYNCVDYISIQGMVEVNSVAFQTPAPYFPPQQCFPGFVPPAAAFPIPSFPAAPVYTVPYKAVINSGLQTGRNILIQGLVNPGAKGFAFNLRHRSGIAFHYNPRFNERVVVRNSHHMEKWGPEERFGGMPFQQGQPFQITISCNPHHYNVFVNGQQAHTFKYRHTNLSDIDVLEVTGDVQLTHVQV